MNVSKLIVTHVLFVFSTISLHSQCTVQYYDSLDYLSLIEHNTDWDEGENYVLHVVWENGRLNAKKLLFGSKQYQDSTNTDLVVKMVEDNIPDSLSIPNGSFLVDSKKYTDGRYSLVKINVGGVVCCLFFLNSQFKYGMECLKTKEYDDLYWLLSTYQNALNQ